MSALSDALVEANVDQLSGREIARRAGDRVHFATVNDYLRGRHGRPTEEVLGVFSEVLKVPMPRLRELADLPAGELGAWEPPRVADRLDRRQRRVLEELIYLLARTEGKAGGGDAEQGATKEGTSRVVPKTAENAAAMMGHLDQIEAGSGLAPEDQEEIDEALEVLTEQGRGTTEKRHNPPA